MAADPEAEPFEARGASVIVLERGAVLMVRRAKGPFAGRWSFPGGRSESGEAGEATARRELGEETGLAVGSLVRLGSFRPAPEQSPLVLTVFAARAAGGAVRAGDDALQAEFVAFRAVLVRPTTPGAAGWITRALIALADPPPPGADPAPQSTRSGW
jgi:8-oxo-dGTP diphosphatase